MRDPRTETNDNLLFEVTMWRRWALMEWRGAARVFLLSSEIRLQCWRHLSSASDLAKFLIAIGEGKLLKPASLEEHLQLAEETLD